jgi:hypothetical protein
MTSNFQIIFSPVLKVYIATAFALFGTKEVKRWKTFNDKK